jgi:hypothetical protein
MYGEIFAHSLRAFVESCHEQLRGSMVVWNVILHERGLPESLYDGPLLREWHCGHEGTVARKLVGRLDPSLMPLFAHNEGRTSACCVSRDQSAACPCSFLSALGRPNGFFACQNLSGSESAGVAPRRQVVGWSGIVVAWDVFREYRRLCARMIALFECPRIFVVLVTSSSPWGCGELPAFPRLTRHTWGETA